jgi:hypothetical protein
MGRVKQVVTDDMINERILKAQIAQHPEKKIIYREALGNTRSELLDGDDIFRLKILSYGEGLTSVYGLPNTGADDYVNGECT